MWHLSRIGVARRREGAAAAAFLQGRLLLGGGPSAVVVFKSFVGAAGFGGALEDDASQGARG